MQSHGMANANCINGMQCTLWQVLSDQLVGDADALAYYNAVGGWLAGWVIWGLGV